ncbi:MAG: PQQ-binding-like beta-propeller repeat protein [Planctomycetaceae bacterium]
MGYRLSLSACSLLVLGTVSMAGDWTEFRGPTGQGLAGTNDLPLEWGDDRNVLWKQPVEGLAWSSPVVQGDRVYLTTAVPEGDERQVLSAVALSLVTGERLWDQPLVTQAGKVQMHSKNSHASPTPIIEGDHLYVHFGPHLTACLSAKDGSKLWETAIAYEPQHGTGGSPAVAGDLLIICCDGRDQQFVVGLDKRTGEERWRTPRETSPKKGFSFCTPLVIELDGQPQAICPGSDAVFAYEPATGKEIWRVRYDDGYSVVPRPVYAQGLLFVGTSYDRARLIAIDPRGRGDITESNVRWMTDRAAPHNPSVVVVKNELYMVSDKGVATCLNATTGEQLWQERLGGNYSASLLASDDRVYFQDEAGVCHVVATGGAYQLLARNEWGGGKRTYASFAVADGTLLLRSESELWRVGE